MSDFKVLTDIEHVKLRKNMYVGSCSLEPIQQIIEYKYQSLKIVPGLIKIIEEIYQNSVDAYIRTGQVSKIELTVENTVEGVQITVADDGPGIPVEMVGGRYRPELCWCALRAGTSFADDANRVSGGSFGLGSSLCNILSKHFIGTTQDGKHKCVVECFDGLSSIETKVSKSSKKGTSVSFVPDLSHFGIDSFTEDHIIYLKDQFANLSVMFPEITFVFNGEKFSHKSVRQLAKKFHEDAISAETEKFSLILATSGEDEDFRCLSYSNVMCNRNGGTHVDFILDKIITPLRESIKKKHKIEVLPAQIRTHLLLAIYMRQFPNLRFDSQTKDRITNSRAEVAQYFCDFDFESLAKKILNTPSIIDPMISAILFKKELAEKMLQAKKEKAAKRLKVVNHISAQGKEWEKNVLCIFEGLSASSNFLNVRDSKTMGCYSLRGKVLNVRGKKPVEILKNKEIFELLSVIGLRFGEKASELNYGKILMYCDSDTDGKSIVCLLMNLFSNWPELFEEGRIGIALSPLYICNKGKEERYFYTKEEFEKFSAKGWEVNYIKGLGGLPIGAYRDMLFQPRIITVSVDDDFESLEMAFGNSPEKRKEWMLEQ